MVISGLFIAWKQEYRGSAEFFLMLQQSSRCISKDWCDCHSHHAGSSNCKSLKLQGRDVTCWWLPVCCDRIIGLWHKGSICPRLWQLCHLLSGREIIMSGICHMPKLVMKNLSPCDIILMFIIIGFQRHNPSVSASSVDTYFLTNSNLWKYWSIHNPDLFCSTKDATRLS